MLDESTSMSIIKAITGENSHTCNQSSNSNYRLSTKIITGVENADSDVKQEIFTNLTMFGGVLPTIMANTNILK